MASNDKVIGEWWNGKHFQGSSRGLIVVLFPVFAWRQGQEEQEEGQYSQWTGLPSRIQVRSGTSEPTFLTHDMLTERETRRGLDDWLTVHRSITLVDLQLDAQNSYLFTYNTFIKILYMFRTLLCLMEVQEFKFLIVPRPPIWTHVLLIPIFSVFIIKFKKEYLAGSLNKLHTDGLCNMNFTTWFKVVEIPL